LALVWRLIKDRKIENKEKLRILADFDKVLGLDLEKTRGIKITQEIKKLAESRENARKEKNWEKADKIRKEIEKQGYKIEDAPEGPKIKKI